jgi:hypothetical protein
VLPELTWGPDVQRLKIALPDWLKQIAGHEPPPVE